MKKEQSRKLAAEIKSIQENIKAEILLASLLKAGFSLEELQVENAGSFTRPYRKDVLNAGIQEEKRGQYSLKVQLSRNGLYDLLPEALAHSQELGSSTEADVKALTEGYKRRKQEETMARKFFRPLENEFFVQGIRLEQEEQTLLYHSDSVFYSFLSQFWGIAGLLPHYYETVLLRLMPHMNTIAGNFERIKHCLEAILEVGISYEMEYRSLEVPSEHNRLGAGKLGAGFMAGSTVHAVPFAVFYVGPVEQRQLLQFLPGGDTARFLDLFFRYTVPLEAEVDIKVLSGRFSEKEESSSMGVLGYSSAL